MHPLRTGHIVALTEKLDSRRAESPPITIIFRIWFRFRDRPAYKFLPHMPPIAIPGISEIADCNPGIDTFAEISVSICHRLKVERPWSCFEMFICLFKKTQLLLPELNRVS